MSSCTFKQPPTVATLACRACYEISCANTWTKDNYGAHFDRTKSCFDTSASVIVRIVDTCQCTYPANAWSNKRW